MINQKLHLCHIQYLLIVLKKLKFPCSLDIIREKDFFFSQVNKFNLIKFQIFSKYKLIFIICQIGMNEKNFEQYDLNFPDLIHPNFVNWLKQRGFTIKNLRELYFENKKITPECSIEYADMVGDILFVCGLHDVAKIQVIKKGSPTYFYKFTHDIGTSFMKKVVNVDEPGIKRNF